MSDSTTPREGRNGEILNIDEAAAFLGVSVKTFNKVLHSEGIPGRKIGREWKFSRSALVAWIGSGKSADFYKDGRELEPQPPPQNGSARPQGEASGTRRTSGWRVKMD